MAFLPLGPADFIAKGAAEFCKDWISFADAKPPCTIMGLYGGREQREIEQTDQDDPSRKKKTTLTFHRFLYEGEEILVCGGWEADKKLDDSLCGEMVALVFTGREKISGGRSVNRFRVFKIPEEPKKKGK